METFIKAIHSTPIHTILILGGLFILVLAFVAKIGGIIEVSPEQKRWAIPTGLFLLSIGLVLYFTTLLTTTPSEWMSSYQYQQEFNAKSQNGFYPSLVEGKCTSAGERFRVEWKTIPPGAFFASHHGLSKETYESTNAYYSSQGYSLEFMNTFKDCVGVDRYQATWLKR